MRWERPKDEEKFCNADVNHHCADRNTQVQILRACLALSSSKAPAFSTRMVLYNRSLHISSSKLFYLFTLLLLFEMSITILESSKFWT